MALAGPTAVSAAGLGASRAGDPSEAFEAASARLDALKANVGELRALARHLDARDEALRAEEAALAARAAGLDEASRHLLAELTVARDEVRALAVEGYVAGGGATALELLLDGDAGNDLVHRTLLVRASATSRATATGRLERLTRTAGTALAALAERLGEVRATLGRVQADARAAHAALADAEAELPAAQAGYDKARPKAYAPGTDIPHIVLDAYRNGADLAAAEAPSCGVEWWMLAGIGAAETVHAHHARNMAANGDAEPMYGPRLDGTTWALVVDTDAGTLDADDEYDRAVGPMQFLPGSWRGVRRDGNGDRVRNPANVFDAAAAAAAYLCRAAAGESLTDPAVLRRALYSYNHSDRYVDGVVATGLRYRDALGS